MTTVLLTGFEPFGGDLVNPSGEAVRRLAAQWSGPETLITAVLPVTFDGAAERLAALIDEHLPDIVIAAGLAGDRARISIERVAVNLIDARIPDNSGAQPIDEPSLHGAPAAYFTSLPAKAIAGRIAEAGIPAEISYSAGSFVCNHTFFLATDAAARRPEMRAGFIHLPWSTEHAPSTDAPALPMAEIVRALEIAVRTSLALREDDAVTAGALA